MQSYCIFMKYAKKVCFFFYFLVNSKKRSTFSLALGTKQVFLAQLVEKLTLNQRAQSSSL